MKVATLPLNSSNFASRCLFSSPFTVPIPVGPSTMNVLSSEHNFLSFSKASNTPDTRPEGADISILLRKEVERRRQITLSTHEMSTEGSISPYDQRGLQISRNAKTGVSTSFNFVSGFGSDVSMIRSWRRGSLTSSKEHDWLVSK